MIEPHATPPSPSPPAASSFAAAVTRADLSAPSFPQARSSHSPATISQAPSAFDAAAPDVASNPEMFASGYNFRPRKAGRAESSKSNSTVKSQSTTDVRQGSAKFQTQPHPSIAKDLSRWQNEDGNVVAGAKRSSVRGEEEEEEELPPKKKKKTSSKSNKERTQFHNPNLTDGACNFLIQVANAAHGPGALKIQELANKLRSSSSSITSVTDITSPSSPKDLGDILGRLNTKLRNDELVVAFSEIRFALQISEFVQFLSFRSNDCADVIHIASESPARAGPQLRGHTQSRRLPYAIGTTEGLTWFSWQAAVRRTFL